MRNLRSGTSGVKMLLVVPHEAIEVVDKLAELEVRSRTAMIFILLRDVARQYKDGTYVFGGGASRGEDLTNRPLRGKDMINWNDVSGEGGDSCE